MKTLYEYIWKPVFIQLSTLVGQHFHHLRVLLCDLIKLSSNNTVRSWKWNRANSQKWWSSNIFKQSLQIHRNPKTLFWIDCVFQNGCVKNIWQRAASIMLNLCIALKTFGDPTMLMVAWSENEERGINSGEWTEAWDIYAIYGVVGTYDTLSANVVNLFPKRYQNSDDQQDEENIFSKIPWESWDP